MNKRFLTVAGACAVVLSVTFFVIHSQDSAYAAEGMGGHDRTALGNAARMIAEGRHTFRFDTFGDEAFWGDTLKLHSAIEGARVGGVGPGVSPKSALSVGLKVDSRLCFGILIQLWDAKRLIIARTWAGST